MQKAGAVFYGVPAFLCPMCVPICDPNIGFLGMFER